ncbi:hypothetical protein [Sphaerisporangium perillae]|uniref:hypothetical protein n=1 Tax=Sphaerisporangium perillae TaxID=2935860 RepID=UPI00200F2ECB|nr:hypothetical protein [Sphaerisporangium perillae]
MAELPAVRPGPIGPRNLWPLDGSYQGILSGGPERFTVRSAVQAIRDGRAGDAVSPVSLGVMVGIFLLAGGAALRAFRW